RARCWDRSAVYEGGSRLAIVPDPGAQSKDLQGRPAEPARAPLAALRLNRAGYGTAPRPALAREDADTTRSHPCSCTLGYRPTERIANDESHRSQAPRLPQEVAAVRHPHLPANLLLDPQTVSA